MTTDLINDTPPTTPGQVLPTIPPPPPRPWGYHGIFDCNKCDLAKIQDQTVISQWVAELSTTLNWTAISKIAIAVNGTLDANTAGFVVYQAFNNGSLSVHISDNNKQIYVDLFSYAEFDPIAVDNSLIKYFGDTVEVRKVLMPRNAAVG